MRDQFCSSWSPFVTVKQAVVEGLETSKQFKGGVSTCIGQELVVNDVDFMGEVTNRCTSKAIDGDHGKVIWFRGQFANAFHNILENFYKFLHVLSLLLDQRMSFEGFNELALGSKIKNHTFFKNFAPDGDAICLDASRNQDVLFEGRLERVKEHISKVADIFDVLNAYIMTDAGAGVKDTIVKLENPSLEVWGHAGMAVVRNNINFCRPVSIGYTNNGVHATHNKLFVEHVDPGGER